MELVQVAQHVDDLDRAIAVIQAIRPDIRKFHSSEYINDLANGDICAAWGYSGDVVQARSRAQDAKNGVDIAYTIPKEGAMIWIDMMAIPADARVVVFTGHPRPHEALAGKWPAPWYKRTYKSVRPVGWLNDHWR